MAGVAPARAGARLTTMPYEWNAPPDTAAVQIHLWPYRSLPKAGFVWFMGATAALLTLPLISLLGTPGLWALLPFLLAAVGAIWIALQHSYRTVSEDLTLAPERIILHRHAPRRPDQTWEANPHWVRPALHPTGGPVPHYLTLSGGGREVELGAFLTPAERQELHGMLLKYLSDLRKLPTSP
jgi:uncharacterized membrane protein